MFGSSVISGFLQNERELEACGLLMAVVKLQFANGICQHIKTVYKIYKFLIPVCF